MAFHVFSLFILDSLCSTLFLSLWLSPCLSFSVLLSASLCFSLLLTVHFLSFCSLLLPVSPLVSPCAFLFLSASASRRVSPCVFSPECIARRLPACLSFKFSAFLCFSPSLWFFVLLTASFSLFRFLGFFLCHSVSLCFCQFLHDTTRPSEMLEMRSSWICGGGKSTIAIRRWSCSGGMICTPSHTHAKVPELEGQ